VEVVYDSERVDFRKGTRIFLQRSRPDDQGPTRQGRWSALSFGDFYLDGEQKRIASATIADIDGSNQWHDKIMTEVTAVEHFWEGESEHQDYLQKQS
jgi:peptide-methionine (S)-S-oxide reductase